MTDRTRTAIVIGAGPAGLTAALELLERTDIRPIVLEASQGVGGISRTHVHDGNRIDLGGHRFFSKSDRVMTWWQRILPIFGEDEDLPITYHHKTRMVHPDTGEEVEDCMLVRNRVSRILWRGTLFDYPLSLNAATLRKLGLGTTMLAGLSYLRARLAPVRPEESLEDFIINRFGRHLYGAFFRDYTEKVWGVPCTDIPADWGRQRIKGVSISRVLRHALAKAFGRRDGSVGQKGTETSLIERFLYPKYGPGHMWERVADRVVENGGDIRFGHRVVGLETDGNRVAGVVVEDGEGVRSRLEADYVFSTMAVRDLVAGLSPAAPMPVQEVCDALPYRDFLIVGLLLDRLALEGGIRASELAERLPDNWIYVQEPGVRVGRLQIFNNWSPYMVRDPETIWVGMEFFLDEGDPLWTGADADTKQFAIDELCRLGFIEKNDVRDATVLRQKKAYPAYFGSYERFGEVREFLSGFDNLILLGRNGQHRYNNQDHSMLTAMLAVDNLVAGTSPMAGVWEVNTEDDYHEEKRDGG